MKKTSSKVLNIVGIILCIIIAPMLIINCTLIIKGWTNQNAVPSVGGVFPMIVLTNSMISDDPASNIEAGDLIICKTIDGEEAEIGDIITFYDPDGNGTTTVTHRIVAKDVVNGETVFTTRGDANNADDQSQVKASDVIGEYWFKIKGFGKVAIFMQTKWGFIVCVGIPIVLFVVYDIIQRRISHKEKVGKIEELEKQLEELKQKDAQNQESSSG